MVFMTHGTTAVSTTLGITEDMVTMAIGTAVSTTHGITADGMTLGTAEDIGDGTTHGIITTTAGTTRTTITSLHTLWAEDIETMSTTV